MIILLQASNPLYHARYIISGLLSTSLVHGKISFQWKVLQFFVMVRFLNCEIAVWDFYFPCVYVYETWGPFYKHGLTLIPAWIRNCIHIKCGMKLLIHSQTSTVQPLKFGNVISSHTEYRACNYMSMLELKLNSISKRGHWSKSSEVSNGPIHWRMGFSPLLVYPSGNIVSIMERGSYWLGEVIPWLGEYRAGGEECRP